MSEERPTVLCVQITSGPFFALTMPAALVPLNEVTVLIEQIESLGRDVDIDYVWR